jgi:hypothetical protein
MLPSCEATTTNEVERRVATAGEETIGAEVRKDHASWGVQSAPVPLQVKSIA